MSAGKKSKHSSKWMQLLTDGIDWDNIDWAKLFTNVLQCALHLFNEFRQTQFAKSLIPLVVLSCWNFIASFLAEDTTTVIARLAFIVKNIGHGLVLFRIKQLVEQAQSEGELEDTVEVTRQDWTDEGKMVNRKETITYGEYDLEQVWTTVKQQGMQVGMVTFLHWYWGYTTPLVITSFMGVQQIMDFPLYKLYMSGVSASDDKTLKRPFASQDPMVGY